MATRPKALFLIAALLLCGCQDKPPSVTAHGKIFLEVTNSLALPNHRVAINVSGNQLFVTRQDNDGDQLEASKELTTDELESLWISVDAVNWRSVKKDNVSGLDGTTYRIRFGAREFEVWTPEDNTEERGLTQLVDLKKLLWRIADITR